jgi:acylphosphatase
MAARRLHAVISGEVQMVGFRAFACREASRLGLNGRVRNLPTGDVEVVAEGDEPTLRVLLGRLREGPRAARVTGVDVSWQDPVGEPPGFRIGW